MVNPGADVGVELSDRAFERGEAASARPKRLDLGRIRCCGRTVRRRRDGRKTKAFAHHAEALGAEDLERIVSDSSQDALSHHEGSKADRDALHARPNRLAGIRPPMRRALVGAEQRTHGVARAYPERLQGAARPMPHIRGRLRCCRGCARSPRFAAACCHELVMRDSYACAGAQSGSCDGSAPAGALLPSSSCKMRSVFFPDRADVVEHPLRRSVVGHPLAEPLKLESAAA